MSESTSLDVALSQNAAPSQDAALRDDSELRDLATWAHSCATRVLHLFWDDRPDDSRPSEALDAAAAFAAGQLEVVGALQAAAAAHAAAEVDEPAAAAAAQACAHAAAVAGGSAHGAAVAAQSLRALRLSSGDPALLRAEDAHQRSSLPRRLHPLVYGPPAGTVDLRSTDLRAAETPTVTHL